MSQGLRCGSPCSCRQVCEYQCLRLNRAKLRLGLLILISLVWCRQVCARGFGKETTTRFGSRGDTLHLAVQRASAEALLLSGLLSRPVCISNRLRQSVGHYSTPDGRIAHTCAGLRVYGVVLSRRIISVKLLYASLQTERTMVS